MAGYTKWNELGRYVKAGEKGIAIMVPYGRKKKSESDEKQAVELDEIGLDNGSQNPDHQSAGQGTVFFGTGYVYDVSQTEGREIPEVLTLLKGEDKLALNELVDQVIRARGFQVRVVDREAAYGANGVCQWKEKMILIAEDLSPLHRVKTRVHELAHSMMHTEEEYRIHTDKLVLELEAESTAFIVLNDFGMDESDYSFGYLATWQGGDKERIISAFKASGKRIQEAAEEMINAIENILGNDTANAEEGEAVWIELPAAMALDKGFDTTINSAQLRVPITEFGLPPALSGIAIRQENFSRRTSMSEVSPR